MVAARGRGSAPRPRIERATAALAHRGPDGSSHLFSDSIAFGHTRLKIIDLEHGDQPMANEDGSVTTIFNGEIWNHLALRRELESAGHVFKSRCDTEVLVHGYEEWGEGMLSKLSGMFAFAIWDDASELLLLARDRVGKKPLYLAETREGLVFGSDARSVLIAGGLSPELDEEHVAHYLFQRYVNAPATLFRGVSKLRPGHLVRYDRVSVEERPYWQLWPGPAHPLEVDDLRVLVEDAVRARLMSDVPIGVFLSGGVDSSAIAALMQGAGARGFSSFTIGFDDPLYDERPLARITARALGTDHHELVLDPASFVDALPRLSWYRDEPMAEPSEVPLLLLAEHAREHVKVVLTGDGGDEIFGGYPKYRAERVLRAGGPLAALALRAAGGIAARRPNHRQLARAVETMQIDDRLLRWASWFRSFSPAELGRLLEPRLAPSAAHVVDPLQSLLGPYAALDPGRAMLVADFLTYLPDNMLLRSDKVLMAASVEGRMPLLDHRVVERVSEVSAASRVGVLRAKQGLRRSVENVVPPAILRQPKRGFPVPVAQVLTGDRRLEALLLSPRTLDRGLFRRQEVEALVRARDTRGSALKLFTLAAFELWLRTNVDGVRAAPPGDLEELLPAA